MYIGGRKYFRSWNPMFKMVAHCIRAAKRKIPPSTIFPCCPFLLPVHNAGKTICTSIESQNKTKRQKKKEAS